MNGTTLCPHCNTRFKIAGEQLEAHHGMVRCGSCLKPFDARPGFIPDQPGPQAGEPQLTGAMPLVAEAVPVEAGLPVEKAAAAEATTIADKPETVDASVLPEAAVAETAGVIQNEPPQAAHGEMLDFSQPEVVAVEPEADVLPVAQSGENAGLQPGTLAEQVAIVQDEEGDAPKPGFPNLDWIVGSALLVLLLFLQAAYFFRIELAAGTPGLKPVLTSYAKAFGASVPLPQDASLMSIESSDLEADSAIENRIILNVLLRNRATYAQAFPNLELTLNDTQDKPLARRTLVPKDYLPRTENEKTGLPPSRELIIKLPLGIADLKPTGYRLALHYPKQ
ncbi:MAG: zinc-ribbon and DUF3426 domain-containing protein [Gallionella sp.]|nr:zinc-ribbon and DUF3426 domain-containing protein [Gallionella sp.]